MACEQSTGKRTNGFDSTHYYCVKCVCRKSNLYTRIIKISLDFVNLQPVLFITKIYYFFTLLLKFEQMLFKI